MLHWLGATDFIGCTVKVVSNGTFLPRIQGIVQLTLVPINSTLGRGKGDNYTIKGEAVPPFTLTGR